MWRGLSSISPWPLIPQSCSFLLELHRPYLLDPSLFSYSLDSQDIDFYNDPSYDNCSLQPLIGQLSSLVLCTSWRFPSSYDEKNMNLRCSLLHPPSCCLLTIFRVLLDCMHSTLVWMLEYPSNCWFLMQMRSKISVDLEEQ